MSGAIPADPFATVPVAILAADIPPPAPPCLDKNAGIALMTVIIAAAIFTTCFLTGVALPISIIITVGSCFFLPAIISAIFCQTIWEADIAGGQPANNMSLNPDFIKRKVIAPLLPKAIIGETVEGIRTFKTLVNAMFCAEGFFLHDKLGNKGLQNESFFQGIGTIKNEINHTLDHYINQLITLPEVYDYFNRKTTPAVPRDLKAEIGTLKDMDSSRRQVATLMQLTSTHITSHKPVLDCLTTIRSLIKSDFNGNENRFFAACADPSSCGDREVRLKLEQLLPVLSTSLKDFFPNMRTLVTSFVGHCEHQPQIAFREYYDTKIDTNQLAATAEAMTLEQRMLSAFQKDRSQFFLGIIREMGLYHQSNQDVYYSRIFQEELNLGGLPLEPSDLDTHATKGLEDRIRTAFKEKYTSQYILERAGELIGQGIPSDMVGKWLTEKYPATSPEKFLDEEGNDYTQASLYLLLREHKIINPPV